MQYVLDELFTGFISCLFSYGETLVSTFVPVVSAPENSKRLCGEALPSGELGLLILKTG